MQNLQLLQRGRKSETWVLPSHKHWTLLFLLLIIVHKHKPSEYNRIHPFPLGPSLRNRGKKTREMHLLWQKVGSCIYARRNGLVKLLKMEGNDWHSIFIWPRANSLSDLWQMETNSKVSGREVSVSTSHEQIEWKYAKHKYKETNAKVMKQVLGPEVSVRVYLHTCA